MGWYKWLHSNQQLTTWPAFTQALEMRFGPSSYGNHQASLFKLRQAGSVMEYQLQFDTISNRIVGLNFESLLNCFLSGLKDDIQRELAILKPQSLSQAIDLAKLVEDKFTDSRSFAHRPPRGNSHPNTPSNPSILGPAPAPTRPPIRYLSPTEMH